MEAETPVALVETDAGFDAVNDYFYERGWTDGLPIVPPTQPRVEAILAGMPWRKSDDVIYVVPPRMGIASMRQIAVNAVMAGAKPEYLPVIVAALQAVSAPIYGLAHRQTTTHAGAPPSVRIRMLRYLAMTPPPQAHTQPACRNTLTFSTEPSGCGSSFTPTRSEKAYTGRMPDARRAASSGPIR